MSESAVVFKGSKEGIHVHLSDDVDFSVLAQTLEERLAANPGFFKGARVIINTGLRSLSSYEVEAISKIFNRCEGVCLMRLEQKERRQPPDRDGATAMTALTVERSIRSGQQLFHAGHIIIIGDVNPGAEIVAHGNIIVMGALRGVAHAGYAGNNFAFVAANIMAPSQVSIAGVLARQPDNESERNKTESEIARLRDGQIIIEPSQRSVFE